MHRSRKINEITYTHTSRWVSLGVPYGRRTELGEKPSRISRPTRPSFRHTNEATSYPHLVSSIVHDTLMTAAQEREKLYKRHSEPDPQSRLAKFGSTFRPSCHRFSTAQITRKLGGSGPRSLRWVTGIIDISCGLHNAKAPWFPARRPECPIYKTPAPRKSKLN